MNEDLIKTKLESLFESRIDMMLQKYQSFKKIIKVLKNDFLDLDLGINEINELFEQETTLNKIHIDGKLITSNSLKLIPSHKVKSDLNVSKRNSKFNVLNTNEEIKKRSKTPNKIIERSRTPVIQRQTPLLENKVKTPMKEIKKLSKIQVSDFKSLNRSDTKKTGFEKSKFNRSDPKTSNDKIDENSPKLIMKKSVPKLSLNKTLGSVKDFNFNTKLSPKNTQNSGFKMSKNLSRMSNNKLTHENTAHCLKSDFLKVETEIVVKEIVEEPKKLNYPKKSKNLLDEYTLITPFAKAITLTLNSKYLEFEEFKKMLFINHEIVQNHRKFKNIFLDLQISHLGKKIQEIEKNLNHYPKEILENNFAKPFCGSKTSFNTLSLIRKEDESSFSKKDFPDEIINIFRVILILLGEDESNIKQKDVVKYVMNETLKKHSHDSLKTLMVSLSKNLNCSIDLINKISKFMEDKPKLLNSVEIMKFSKSSSYLSFILKEIVEYIVSKAPDGQLYYHIREKKCEIQKFESQITSAKLLFE